MRENKDISDEVKIPKIIPLSKKNSKTDIVMITLV